MRNFFAVAAIAVLLGWTSLAEGAPGVNIVAWPLLPSGVVELHFQVSSWKYPGDGHGVAVYVGDQLREVNLSEKQAVLDDLPLGRNSVAVVLVDCSQGPCVQLENSEARDSVEVDGTAPCSGPGDSSCEDANPCSLDFCSMEDDGSYWCQWGVTPTLYCCTSMYQCKPGEVCGAGDCGPCTYNTDCNDMLDCTSDKCVEGNCRHTVEPDCCVTDEALCDDGDPCTDADRCSAGVCSGEPAECGQAADVVSSGGDLDSQEGSGSCTSGGAPGNAAAPLFLSLILLSLGLLRRTVTHRA
jgi:hypothetical protein